MTPESKKHLDSLLSDMSWHIPPTQKELTEMYLEARAFALKEVLSKATLSGGSHYYMVLVSEVEKL